MLITGLGSHDMIIGRNFFDYFRVLIDVHHRQLHWPQEFPPAKTYSRTMVIHSRDDIRPQQIQRQYQQDMFRRDRAIAQNEKRRQDGVQIKVLTCKLVESIPSLQDAPQTLDNCQVAQPSLEDKHAVRKAERHRPTWEQQNQRDIARMNQELSRPHDYQQDGYKKPGPGGPAEQGGSGQQQQPLAIDIKMISANGFILNARQPKAEIFSITLDGLDRMIADRKQELQEQQPAETDESLKAKVPPYLHYCLDFFSKQQLDTLALH